MLKKKIYLVIFILCFTNLFSINLDSLRIKFSKAKNDSTKIEILFKGANSIKNSVKVNDSLVSVILTFTNSPDCYLQLFSYYKVGLHYISMEKKQTAMEFLLKALEVADKCKSNNYGLMIVRHKLGYLNKVTDHIPAAKTNLHLSRYYAQILKDSGMLADNYTILGNIYKNDMILDSALGYHFKALEIRERHPDKRLLALTYNNIGLVYKNMKEYKTALNYLRKSLNLKIETKDVTLPSAYNNIGIIFNRMKLYDSAIVSAKKGMDYCYKAKVSESLFPCIEVLGDAYDGKKDVVNALYYYKRFKKVKDSVSKEEISSQFQEMQSKYESDKKDIDLKLKEESLKTADAINSRKNILIILSSIALLMAVIASIFIFRSYKQSKRNSVQLEFKNKIIEEKNREITDSINYAKNIQQSLITNQKVFADNLKDQFILYLPKDIVSGDFYWAQKIGNEFIIVCADCTGHGVPGAFMSLMAIGYLKEIVNPAVAGSGGQGQKQITRPDIILNELRDRIIEGFSLNNNKDGMDASLIKLNGLQLQVAAANNPIWIIRNNENIVVRPDKFPIGNYLENNQPFTLNTIELKENDLVLMYTDGYADQFGGPNNKKHKNKAIEKLILDNHQLPLENLKKLLLENLKEWQGDNEQVDDILVIGFRV